jgi:hypothetical protein
MNRAHHTPHGGAASSSASTARLHDRRDFAHVFQYAEPPPSSRALLHAQCPTPQPYRYVHYSTSPLQPYDLDAYDRAHGEIVESDGCSPSSAFDVPLPSAGTDGPPAGPRSASIEYSPRVLPASASQPAHEDVAAAAADSPVAVFETYPPPDGEGEHEELEDADEGDVPVMLPLASQVEDELAPTILPQLDRSAAAPNAMSDEDEDEIIIIPPTPDSTSASSFSRADASAGTLSLNISTATPDASGPSATSWMPYGSPSRPSPSRAALSIATRSLPPSHFIGTREEHQHDDAAALTHESSRMMTLPPHARDESMPQHSPPSSPVPAHSYASHSRPPSVDLYPPSIAAYDDVDPPSPSLVASQPPPDDTSQADELILFLE